MLRRLEEIPAQWAERRPEAVVLREGARAWTWDELERSREHLAGTLAALGVRAGDRVMLVGENCASMIVLFFALATLDAWIVNVNARMSAREIELIRAHARPRRVIYLAGVSPAAREHAVAHGAIDLDLGGWGEVQISSLDAEAPAEPLDDEAAQRV